MQYIWFLAILFVIHYLADFFIQVYTWKSTTRWLRTMITHVVTYIFVMMFGLIILESIFPSVSIHYHSLLAFIGINAAVHFIVDVGAKKLAQIMHKHNEITGFVNVVALDQCLHYITLLITFGIFFVK